MTIFWRLLFGHMVADFTLQTNYIATWKQKSRIGLFVHCATHPLVYILLCWPYLMETWVKTQVFELRGWAVVMALFALHYVEDYCRVIAINRRKWPDDMTFFLWDQVFHVGCLLAIIPLGLQQSNVPSHLERWPVMGGLAVFVTHFLTVFLYYLEKDLFDTPYPDVAEKYWTMFERLCVSGLFLAPDGWGYLLPAAWAFIAYRLREKYLVEFSLFSFYIGGAMAAMAGIVGRYVFY